MTVMVGFFHEYSQIAGPRDADVWDLGRDAAGALTFLGLYMTFDKKMKAFRGKRDRAMRLIIVAGAFILMLPVIVPIAVWGGAYIYRNQQFPVICGFESPWENKFLKTENSMLETILPPKSWTNKTANKVAKTTFFASEYSQLAVIEPYPDWSDYDSFNIAAFSELKFPVELTLRIEDSSHNDDYDDRFNKILEIQPGLNAISIPLAEVQRAPLNRDMDMTSIRGFILFAQRPEKEFVLYFDDFRLE